jgi:RES domain-containing protein
MFNAVYGSLEPETAMDESLANYREFGIPVSEAMPLVFVAVTVKVQAVLDLSSADVQRGLGVSLRRMTASGWPGCPRARGRGPDAGHRPHSMARTARRAACSVGAAEGNTERRTLPKPPQTGQFLEDPPGAETAPQK